MASGRTLSARGHGTRASGAGSGVGARVREARAAAGLTQAELGGDRFSKEYVSQVELGKTRPSDAALDWFSHRLGVARPDLEGEALAAVQAAAEAAVVRAEAAIEAGRHADALAELDELGPAGARPQDPRLGPRLALAPGCA